jgi:hypothetical protein
MAMIVYHRTYADDQILADDFQDAEGTYLTANTCRGVCGWLVHESYGLRSVLDRIVVDRKRGIPFIFRCHVGAMSLGQENYGGIAKSRRFWPRYPQATASFAARRCLFPHCHTEGIWPSGSSHPMRRGIGSGPD